MKNKLRRCQPLPCIRDSVICHDDTSGEGTIQLSLESRLWLRQKLQRSDSVASVGKAVLLPVVFKYLFCHFKKHLSQPWSSLTRYYSMRNRSSAPSCQKKHCNFAQWNSKLCNTSLKMLAMGRGGRQSSASNEPRDERIWGRKTRRRSAWDGSGHYIWKRQKRRRFLR